MRISDWSSDVCSSDLRYSASLSISRSAVEQPFQNQPFIEWECWEVAVESKSSPESSPGKMAAQRLLEALAALPMLQALCTPLRPLPDIAPLHDAQVSRLGTHIDTERLRVHLQLGLRTSGKIPDPASAELALYYAV